MNQVTQDHQTIEAFGYRCRIGRQAEGFPTIKQAHVIAGIAAGMTQKEIAKALGIAPSTVKSTAETLYFWLHAIRATDAVAKAMRLTWIAPLLLCIVFSVFSPDAHWQRPPRNNGNRDNVVNMNRSSRRQESYDFGSLAA